MNAITVYDDAEVVNPVTSYAETYATTYIFTSSGSSASNGTYAGGGSTLNSNQSTSYAEGRTTQISALVNATGTTYGNGDTGTMSGASGSTRNGSVTNTSTSNDDTNATGSYGLSSTRKDTSWSSSATYGRGGDVVPTRNSGENTYTASYTTTTATTEITVGQEGSTSYNTDASYYPLTTVSLETIIAGVTTSTWSTGYTQLQYDALDVYNPGYTSPDYVPITKDGVEGTLSSGNFTHTNHYFIGRRVSTLIYLDDGERLWTLNTGAALDNGQKGYFTDLFQSVAGSAHTLEPHNHFRVSTELVTCYTVTDSSFYNTTNTQTAEATISHEVEGVAFDAGLGFHTHEYSTYGYDDQGAWVEGTSSGFWSGAVSYLVNYVTWWNSIEKSVGMESRSTAVATVLKQSNVVVGEGTDTSVRALGQVTATVQVVFSVYTTVTVSSWVASLTPALKDYAVTTSAYDSAGQSAMGYTTKEGITREWYTSERLMAGYSYYQPNNGADHSFRVFGRVYPRGYVGWGGSGIGTDLPNIAVTASAQLVIGEEFDTVSLEVSNLESVSIFGNVTMFPVKSPLATFTLPHGNGRYMSTVDSIGSAAVAVTWTSTTDYTNGTGTMLTSKSAEYDLYTESLITGEFVSEYDRGGYYGGHYYGESSGSRAGHVYPDHPWSITAAGFGRLSLTKYLSGDTNGIPYTIDNMENFSIFNLENAYALAYRGEPLLHAVSTDGSNGHFEVRTVYTTNYPYNL